MKKKIEHKEVMKEKAHEMKEMKMPAKKKKVAKKKK